MEASALTHAQRRGLLARPSPLLRLQGDEKLVALTRAGNAAAFETLVARYQPRLLGFCRQMLRSTEDAEDVLQEVFVAAYKAMVADERPIAVRPWLYRIARNRSLNHLRKPTADAQETMDTLPHLNGVTTLERVQTREEFRSLIVDVSQLPETQRTALLLREIDAMSYEEIAQSMETTIPGVKSLLVRARISLAESSESRQLTCGEVRLGLAEAAEGLAKATGAVRRHVRACDTCRGFRDQLGADSKMLSVMLPLGSLAALKGLLAAKLFGAGAGGGAAAGGGTAGSGVVGGAAAMGGGAVSGGAGAVAAAIGTKAAVGLATAALLTAGAVEVKRVALPTDSPSAPAAQATPKRDAKPNPRSTNSKKATTAAAPAAATDPTAPDEVLVVPEQIQTATASEGDHTIRLLQTDPNTPGTVGDLPPGGSPPVDAPPGGTDPPATPPASEPGAAVGPAAQPDSPS